MSKNSINSSKNASNSSKNSPNSSEFDPSKILSIKSQSIIEKKGIRITVVIYNLHNGYLMLITDQDTFGLGTLSISIPPNEINDRSIGTPLSTFGLKYTTLTNIIGKRASKMLGKPVLTMLSLQEHDIPLKILQKIVMDTVAAALES
ncbi:MAG: hypothetical protein K9W44_03150 [Candidatus Lokiarchaeota archaeon]|nr:hypothetical protein [Candidatus Harpocratesius repetitus]